MSSVFTSARGGLVDRAARELPCVRLEIPGKTRGLRPYPPGEPVDDGELRGARREQLGELFPKTRLIRSTGFTWTSVTTSPAGLLPTLRMAVKSTFIIMGVIMSQIRIAMGALI